jgi:DNA-binding transcriptional LysR family regulator
LAVEAPASWKGAAQLADGLQRGYARLIPTDIECPIASDAVRRVLEDWELSPVDLWAVFPTGRLASAKARAFTDYVQSILDQ